MQATPGSSWYQAGVATVDGDSRLQGADVIVVGLGAMGSAVTCALARRGLRVIGIDRFHPPHDRGSTHGDTRITRLAIGEGPEYVPLVRRSHELWRELERETGTTLLHQVGGLVIGDHDDPFLAKTRAAAALYEIAHENLDRRELTRRFPMFDPPDGTEAYFEPQAGFTAPEAAVSAQLGLARALGAQLRLGEQVRSFDAGGAGVTLTTDVGTLRADRLVVCAGAWITRLLPETAGTFAVYPQILHWFPIHRGFAELSRMPVFIWEMDGARDAFTHLAGGFYGFPPIDGRDGGMKLATEVYDATVGPDEPRADATAVASATTLHRRYLSRYFPWVGATPVRIASCLYTNTRGSRFLIGPHPSNPKIMIVAACSGHGFKHSPAIGEAVAQTVTDGASEIDLVPFAIGAETLS